MKHAAILAALIGGLLWLAAGKIVTTPYGYDESDYMFDASFGYYANWIDAGTLPIADFVQLGLRRGADPNQRLALSHMVRNSRDPVIYRHWHGPLYSYWLVTLAPEKLPEETMRGLSLLFPLLTAIVLYFGTLRILPGSAAQPAAILSCALFLWNEATVKTTGLAPHMLFVLCYVAALLLLAKVMAGGGRRYWYGSVIAAGLAFCVLEVAFVLIATLAICAYPRRKELGAGRAFMGRAFMGRSVLALVAPILLVWPSAILKLSFLKAWFFMAYLAVFRKSPWGGTSFFETWALRFTSNPVEWILIAAALALFFRRRLWRQVPEVLPFIVYSALMILVVLRVNSEEPRYVMPFFPSLLIFAGWTLGWELSRIKSSNGILLRYGSVAAICVTLFCVTRWHLTGYLERQDPCPGATLAAIRERGLEAAKLVVPQMTLPMLHYYFPRAAFRAYMDDAEIPRAIDEEHPDAVLYLGCPVRLEMPARYSP
jgi:hypothetical protein